MLLLGAVVVILQALGYFWWFIMSPGVHFPVLRGPVIGGGVCVLILAAALWRRRVWARYMLIVVNWGMIALFSMMLIIFLGDQEVPVTEPRWILLLGLVLYFGANIILIFSRSIKLLAHRPTRIRV